MQLIRSSAVIVCLYFLASCTPAPTQHPTSPHTQTVQPSATQNPPTPTYTKTPPPTATQIPPTSTPPIDPFHYVQSCEQVDKISNAYDRQYALELLRFQPEPSEGAQSQLDSPVIVAPSCNVRLDNNPQYIVLHGTRGGLVASISEFQGKDNSSAHYIIDRDGQVYQLVPESLIAFHVTCCIGQGGRVMPDYRQSIGIELVNKLYVNPESFEGPIYEDYFEAFGYRYWEDFPEEQIHSLVILIEDITSRWNIPMENVIGHYLVNDTVDPGPALNLFWWRNGNPPRDPIFPAP